jgi:hypothetical protein
VIGIADLILPVVKDSGFGADETRQTPYLSV